jgi:hypothetical protein
VIAELPDGTAFIGPQSVYEERVRRQKIERKLRTLDNIAGGILGALGFGIGSAASDDPAVADAASDLGALGDQVLTAPGIANEVSPKKSTAPAQPRRAVPTEPVDRGLRENRTDLLRTLSERQRTRELAYDPAIRGERVSEGIGARRLERGTERTVERSLDPAIDFLGAGLGNISLKGPLRASATGDPIPITDAMVRGLASAAVRGANQNTGVDVVVVDTLGLTDAQFALLLGTIATAGPTRKPIMFSR